MASLTEASILSRKAIRYGIYIIIIIIIGRISFNVGRNIWQKLRPTPPPKPTVKYGELPSLPFPPRTVPDNISYTLETPDGKLPEFTDQLEVYVMPTLQSDIRALENAKEKAGDLGFNSEGKQIVENVKSVYIFNHNNNKSILTMNIITGIFSISYDLTSNLDTIRGTPPDESEAISQAKSLLSRAAFLVDDLKEEAPYTHQYLLFKEGQYSEAISRSEANLTKVNLFRSFYGGGDGYPAVTPNMPESNVWFMLGNDGRVDILISGEYHYFPVDGEDFSTYPLITTDDAWNKLKDGEGFIASLGENQNQVTIRKVYLAYYDAGIYAEYYQPVIVFEGDGGFIAYVPAVDREYYGKADSGDN